MPHCLPHTTRIHKNPRLAPYHRQWRKRAPPPRPPIITHLVLPHHTTALHTAHTRLHHYRDSTPHTRARTACHGLPHPLFTPATTHTTTFHTATTHLHAPAPAPPLYHAGMDIPTRLAWPRPSRQQFLPAYTPPYPAPSVGGPAPDGLRRCLLSSTFWIVPRRCDCSQLRRRVNLPCTLFLRYG